jgi:RNA polymerase sigma factor (sigma-70 family)
MTDWQLLRKYADDNSQAAFAQLSQRYTNLVYRVCQRELGDPSLAEDAAQAVFLILARKASSLHPTRQEATLSAWLFQTALLTAKNARRQEQRRMAKEEEAAQMQPPAVSPGWAEIEPLLNDALQALPPGQRSLLIERFFHDRPLSEIGAHQRISEDAARMRVNRALDRLRRFFAARNVTLSVAALAALLPQAVRPAPAHAAEAIARLALPANGTLAFILAQGAIHTMNTQRLKLQIGAAALVAAFSLGTVGAVQVTTQMKVRRIAAEQQENQSQALAVLNQMYATYAAMKSFKCSTETQETPGLFARAADYEIEKPNKIRFHQVSLYDATQPGQALAVSDGNSLYVTSTEPFEQTHGAADRYAKIDLIKNSDNSFWFVTFGDIAVSGYPLHAGIPEVALGLKLGPISMGAPEDFVTEPVYSLGQPTSVYKDIDEEKVPVDVVIARMEQHQRVLQGAKLIPSIKVIPIVFTYYIGQSDHLLYECTRSDMFKPNEWSTETQQIYSQVINRNLPTSDFVFTPPPGSHEVSDPTDLVPGGIK